MEKVYSMSVTEKSFYEKAKSKGIRLLEVGKNKITFVLNNEYVKITYSHPSKEFINLMSELYEG
jgi:hypothetical protein